MSAAQDENGLAGPEPTPAPQPVLALMLLCGVLLLHVLYLACVSEDGHITFRFARNVAQGHGFVWNVGEPPIEGFTTILWVLIAAAGIRAGLDVFLLTQCLGTLAAVGTLLLTFEFARRRLAASNRVALAPCVFLAVSGPLATWAGSSMETTTFGLFVLLGVFLYVAHLQRPSQRALLGSGLSLCVATLLRPEGTLVFLVLSGLSLSVFRARTRTTIRAYVAWALTYALPLALFAAWRLHEFGDPLPNTLYAKTGGGFWQYVRGVGYISYFALFYLLPLVSFPALLWWEVGLPEKRRLMRREVWARWMSSHEAAAVCGAIVLAYLAYVVYVGGDYMAMYRFMVPILPFLYLLLVPVLERLQRSTLGLPHKAQLLALVVAVAAAATALSSTPLEGSIFRVAQWQHGNHRGVLAERWYVARFSLIGRFFEQNRRGPSETLATRTIGAIGYYAEHLSIDDLSGLTDRHIAHKPIRSTAQGWTGHEKWDLDYSFARLPTYLLLDINLAANDISGPSRTSALAMADALEEAYPKSRLTRWVRAHPDFIEQHYQLTTVWLDDQKNTYTGSFLSSPPRDKGYLAFLERKDHASQRTARDER